MLALLFLVCYCLLSNVDYILILVLLGVTNVPEFLLWWDTNNRLYGSTKNPYDLSHISGGSSGGEI